MLCVLILYMSGGDLQFLSQLRKTDFLKTFQSNFIYSQSFSQSLEIYGEEVDEQIFLHISFFVGYVLT